MGSWSVLPYNAPILPIHAALLHTGKVFFFAGSGNNPSTTTYNDLINACAVWQNPAGATSNFTRPTIPLNGSGQPYDIFCAGQTFRNEGLLMVAGGTLQYDPFKGLTVAMMFDPGPEQWVTKPSMHNGRWYPTLLTLGDGRIFALGGLNSQGANNQQPEIYSDTFTNGWNAFPSTTSPFPLYAHLFLLQDGSLFYSGGCMGGNYGVSPRRLTLPNSFSSMIGETAVGGLANADAGNQAASVLLPPAQSQKVMIMGGGDSMDMGVSRVAIADFTAASPAYTTAPSLHYARMHLSAILLPDRTVLVCNGSQMSENTSTSSLPAEIYNPATNTWTVVETQSVPRVYHSVALLLPDGRVVTAGGNPARGTDELRLEVYSPSYMSQPRPVIQSAPPSVTYGQTFTIQTPHAGKIQWASLIRPTATTHSCDTEQRVVDLPITARKSDTLLSVAVPGNQNLAPPGYYMLFITDKNTSAGVPNGVPSVATWIHLS